MATATAEPATNGAVTPPVGDDTSTANSGTKRKREDSEPAPLTVGAVPDVARESKPEESSPELRESLKDMLKVLRMHDTTPSILTCSLFKDGDESTSEPSVKRAKLSEIPRTISGRIEGNVYNSFDALIADVEAASEILLAPLRAKELSLPQTQYGRPSALTPDETRLWIGTTSFQKLLRNIIQAEKERHKLVKGGKVLSKTEDSVHLSSDARVKSEEEDTNVVSEGKPVLTLFANAPVPKQLFSSFQHATPGQIDDGIPPLRESGLPGFISTTNIPPVQTDNLGRRKKGTTIGDLFSSTADKYKLQPPKPPKSKLVTTGNTVEFVRVDGPTRPPRRNSYNYFTDKLAVGQWLGYGGLDMPQEPTSPQAKRRQRDRALSTGEAFLPPSEGEKEALRKARNDALFRKVYGSFAPSYDDSSAVVPKDVRNEIWIDKVEERLAQRTLVIDPALLEEPPEPTPEEKKIEMEELKEFVDNFDPKILEWDAEQTKSEKEMDELLQEVSDLLETLASFQRIRNTSLSTSARTTVGQNNPVTDLMGTPTTPSSAELEVYKTLKLQLAVLINQLPPYVVARLNGDRLEELNIKTSIPIETEDARGVMAEDEATRAAKMQAYAAAAGSQSQAGRTPTNSYANYPATANQYSRTPVPQQLRPSGSSNYYTPQAQGQSRPAPIQYNRSSSSMPTYNSNYSQPANRSSFSQNYNQSTPRPGSYQAPGNQHFPQMQNTPANKPSYNPAPYSTPQPQRTAYQQTPTTSFQQRPQGTAPMYSGYMQTQSPHARTNSPQVPPQGQYNQPRQGYSTPAPAASNPSYYRPPSAAGVPQQQPFATGGAYQGQPRMQPTSNSATLTPSRQNSGTPQPTQTVYNQTNGSTPAAAVAQPPAMLSQPSSTS
ncbi:uncharacterized protein PV09_05844 [Verruconis gallopava]|uniref:Uncharacterized protein n=1 Tax=Verruconis gallopava TaxID=253628 RepID=A0A0D1YQ95_9PEZI|nr:uncharacterized protein PV09_05844 [Verruconis gallopava]KIW02782.1 hypothetical protein PV09_05844 [Verruconis gallopava]